MNENAINEEEERIKNLGFESRNEFLELTASAYSEIDLESFEEWEKKDGTKEGLLKLLSNKNESKNSEGERQKQAEIEISREKIDSFFQSNSNRIAYKSLVESIGWKLDQVPDSQKEAVIKTILQGQKI